MAKKETKKELKKGIAKFNLIGTAKVTDESFTINADSTSSDWRYNRMTIGVQCGEDGLIFAEMMGGYGKDRDNLIYVHGIKEDENGTKVEDYENRFQIDWDDRFNKDILELIGSSCFITVGLEKTNEDKTYYKKFLSPYDAIAYSQEHLKSDMTVNVKGKLVYQEYEGNVIAKKIIDSIVLSSLGEDKYRATFQQTILLDKDSIGKYDKETQTIPIQANIVEYINNIQTEDGKLNVKKNLCLTKTFDHKAENKEATEKLINKTYIPKKSSEVYELIVEGRIMKTGTVKEMTVDDLPSDIRDLIDAGLLSEKEAVAKCVISDKKVERMIITNPMIIRSKEEGVLPRVAVTEDKYVVNDLVFYHVAIKDLLKESGVSDNTQETKREEDADEDIDDLQDENIEDLLEDLDL